MNKLFLLISNTLTFIICIFVNYWVNSGALNGKTVGEISAKYETLFTPAGYAFGIWGFIYLSLLTFIGFQWYDWKNNKDTDLINKIEGWFILANLANATWIIVWMQEATGLSVIIMFILLFALIKLVLRLDLEIWDAPVRVIAFVWWPISWYIGWIILASVTNVAAYLTSISWSGVPLTPMSWTMIMIFIATLIYLALIYKRNMREASLIGMWGLLGIVIKQWDINPLISYFAIVAIVFLLFASGYHGYKNRYYSPANKWKRGEI